MQRNTDGLSCIYSYNWRKQCHVRSFSKDALNCSVVVCLLNARHGHHHHHHHNHHHFTWANNISLHATMKLFPVAEHFRAVTLLDSVRILQCFSACLFEFMSISISVLTAPRLAASLKYHNMKRVWVCVGESEVFFSHQRLPIINGRSSYVDIIGWASYGLWSSV